MNLEEILEKVNKFNTNEATEDYELNIFFDEIGDAISKLGELNIDEKKKTITSFFNFLKRQSSELEENWSYIHLIESIDNASFKIYDPQLIKFNKESPTLTSILLLNRFINSLEGDKWKNGVNLLKAISEREDISELVREEANEFYKHQIED